MEPTVVGRCGICGKQSELAAGLCLRLEGCYTGYFNAHVARWPERLDVCEYVRDWMIVNA